MNYIPVDTRNQYKSQPRDSLAFPPSNPAVSAPTETHHIPVYDRNMFSNPAMYNQGPRNVENDRLMQSSMIYQNFANQQHDHFLRPANPYYQQQVVSTVDTKFVQTREKKEEKSYLDERRNLDRSFMTQRNYNAELFDRVNGFGIMPRDTRFESTKKATESNNTNTEMRANRYLGMPGNNL